MDKVNQVILEELKENSRIPLLEISKKLRVSEGTIRNRVSRMQKQGVIKKFTILRGENGGVEAVVGLKLDLHSPTSKIVKKLEGMEGVEEVFELTGRYDVMVLINAETMEELNELIEGIRAMREVMETESFPVLKRS